MLSTRVVPGLLLSLLCICLCIAGTEAGEMYFYASGYANGYVASYDSTWDGARQATTGDVVGFDYINVGVEKDTAQYIIERGFLRFDTSRLPDVTINNAEVRLCVYYLSDSITISDSIYTCGGTQSDSLVLADFNNFVGWHSGSSAYNGPIVGRFAWADLEVDSCITYTLSAAAYPSIYGGNPKGALLTDVDFCDNEPAVSDGDFVRFYGPGASTSQKPRLKVEW
ncbi:hypothetical protein AMJ82_12340 [candidate division TA06 bacterium SM23_40]|uniref:Uncharacterized protein n=1 Tax=candidate division TA06 bacterium SM23_40 TaxID=1703774 RepID=A0A0S8FY98_UNCT6|nr:MAG: hypothetical protein AMJ82_12340 [candidate division TA06 bacterium SM23_40]